MALCLVRVVHSLFAETDDWDNQLTGVESGWPSFFRILRMYLDISPANPVRKSNSLRCRRRRVHGRSSRAR